jgi:phage/plasmid-like protein (TIGR03299 family)
MAHEIKKMFYVGEMPWHGLGVRLPTKASYEEIVQAAGFYEAVDKDVYIPPLRVPIADRKALVRGDTGEYLAVVARRYAVVQFGDVARTLVEAAGDVKAVFTTAGTLGPVGIRGWLLGELPNPITVRGDPSPIRKYVLGTTGHDGVTAVVIKNVATRVVCANTLGSALGEKTRARWQIRHTRSAPERLRDAAQGFRELVRGYEQFGNLANVLAMTAFTDAQLARTVEQVLPVPPDDREHRRLEGGRAKVIELFEAGRGMHGIRGTAWAGLQAFVEFADHHRMIRGGSADPAAARLESIWLGGAAELKRRALAAIADEARIPLAA